MNLPIVPFWKVHVTVTSVQTSASETRNPRAASVSTSQLSRSSVKELVRACCGNSCRWEILQKEIFLVQPRLKCVAGGLLRVFDGSKSGGYHSPVGRYRLVTSGS